MQDNKQADKMSKEEIIKYVDMLIEQNKRRYDKRLSPLLYDFFIRSNEKFDWSREEFLEKYENFKHNVKKICTKKLKGTVLGKINHKKRTIYVDKNLIKEYMEFPFRSSINKIIETLFHECSHATDKGYKNGEISFGFYELLYDSNLGYKKNDKDVMFDEYANTLYTDLISSEKPMYLENLPIKVNDNDSYSELILPGSIICATFDVTEIELAKLKDKGRKHFDLYLKEKFPYMDTEMVLAAFTDNLNLIHNSNKIDDKENLSLGHQNIVDTALSMMNLRTSKIFSQKSHPKETLERIYFDIYKIEQVLKEIDRVYNPDNETKVCNTERIGVLKSLKKRVYLYKRFLDNKNRFTTEEIEGIYRDIDTNETAQIESKFESDYQDEEYDIEAIAEKYYLRSNEPLNNNAELIEKLRNSFRKRTLKERFIETVSNIKREEELPVLVASNIRDRADFMNRIHETPTSNEQDIASFNKENILKNENNEIEGQNEDIR